MNSVQDVIDSIKDIPDTYKNIFNITSDDDFISAVAKARQIKEIYAVSQATAVTNEAAKIRMQKLKKIQDSISDIPADEIAEKNKIKSTDTIEEAQNKARAASRAYYDKLIQDAQQGAFQPLLSYCNVKSSNAPNKDESTTTTKDESKTIQQSTSTSTSGTNNSSTGIFSTPQETSGKVYEETKKDLQELILKARQEAEAAAAEKKSNKDYGVATPIAKAEGTIDDILKRIQDTSKANEEKILQAAADAKTEKEQTALTVLLIADRMAEMSTIDIIAKQVSQSHEYTSGLISKTLLISAYMNKTFGDKKFMKEVTKTLGKGISKYLDSVEEMGLYNLQQKINQTEDGIFTKANQQAQQIIIKAQDTLEKVSKFDLATALDEKLKNCLSIDKLNESLDKTFLGQCLKPGINSIYNASMEAIENKVMDFDFMRDIKKGQDTIIAQQKAIDDAQNFIKSREDMARVYIDGLKSQAETIVKGYADKIVSSIKDAIHIDTGSISL